jgi:hypothetical protein
MRVAVHEVRERAIAALCLFEDEEKLPTGWWAYTRGGETVGS